MLISVMGPGGAPMRPPYGSFAGKPAHQVPANVIAARTIVDDFSSRTPVSQMTSQTTVS